MYSALPVSTETVVSQVFTILFYFDLFSVNTLIEICILKTEEGKWGKLRQISVDNCLSDKRKFAVFP